MADTHETIADIIAEMRKISAEKYRLSSENGGAYGDPGVYYLDFAQFARVISDRFEAAHKRECGDVAKLREALKLCVDEMCNRCRELAAARGNTMPCLSGCEPVRKARAALAEPPRNCDIGTAEEQAKRMDAYCTSYRECIGGCWRCDNCPLCSIHRCELAWAQMPYVEKEGETK